MWKNEMPKMYKNNNGLMAKTKQRPFEKGLCSNEK
jgi:hypothetical protein